VKSLFRYGTALYYLRQYKQAQHEFSNLLKVDPHNKNGLEYLRHTDQKLAKIKREAYEKLYQGEIIGESTGIGKRVIQVEEINMDEKLSQIIEEENSNDLEKVKLSNKNENMKNSNMIEEIEEEKVPEKLKERSSKIEFLSKTDVSNIQRSKQIKIINEFIENSEEQEELRKLEVERKEKKNRRKRGKRKNKNKASGNINQNFKEEKKVDNSENNI